MMSTNSCSECGEEGGASLKVCKSCMAVRYCNAACQHKHWQTHKTACKVRAAELRDEALFKDPPPKEDVKSASYQCHQILFLVLRFHPRQYGRYQCTILKKQMRSLLISKWKNMIHVAGRVFAKGVFTHYSVRKQR